MGEQVASRVRVTLVHGTYARVPFRPHAPWTEPNSGFCAALASRLGDQLHINEPFIWSGLNRVSHRDRATKKLQSDLRCQLLAHPGDRHFIVGHSHGGSIAYSALADPDLMAGLDGVVCLSTPFLHAAPRYRYAADVDRGLIVAVACGLPTVFGSFVAGWQYWSILAGTAVGTAARVVYNVLEKRSRFHLEQMRLPAADAGRVLLTRHTGDEATGMLVSVRFAAWLIDRCSRPIRRLTEHAQSAGERLAGLVERFHLLGFYALAMLFLAAGVLVWGTGRLEGKAPHGWAAVLLATGGLLGGIPMLVLFGMKLAMYGFEIGGTIATVPALLIAAMSAPLSFDLLTSLLFLDVAAEATPEGTWTVHHFGGSIVVGNAPPSGLRHSQSYDDPRVQQLVAVWLLDRSDGGRSRSPSGGGAWATAD